jgi:peptide/nickel transport system substrate-binding protein
VGLLALLSALASTGAATSATTKPVLVIAGGAPSTLDATKLSGGWVQHTLVNANLIDMQPDGTLKPWLATSWRYVGQSNKVFEVTLRHDIRFSDGSKMTAATVKAFFDYFFESKGPYVALFGPIQSIDTVGKWTVRFTLQSPNPTMPILLSDYYNATAPVCAAAVANPQSLGTQPCGAGEYVLDQANTVTGSQYTFLPNKYYYDQSAIKWSKVVVKNITSVTANLQALQTGQIALGAADVSTVAAAQSAGFKVSEYSRGAELITFPQMGRTVPALGDVRVRQALSYAIDRKAVAAAVTHGYGKPASEMSSLDGFDKKFANYYPYNPAKAKQLLAAAGYAKGFEFDVVPLNPDAMLAVSTYLKAVGVKMNVINTDWGQAFLDRKWPAIEHVSFWSRSMWTQFNIYFRPGGLFNYGWQDPVMVKLWLKGQRAKDPTKYWQQMSDRSVTQAYLIPIFSEALFSISDPKKISGPIVPSTPYGVATVLDLYPPK